MATYNVEEIVKENVPNFDEDCLAYLISVIEAMPLEEQQNSSNLEEIITPFLTETGETTEEEAVIICRKIAVAFGSSGMSTGTTVFQAVEELPALLTNTVRIIDNSEETGLVLNPNATYGKVMISSAGGGITGSNTAYDSKAIPTTMREARRMRRTKEQMNELLEREKAKQSAARQEVINARMKALQFQREQIENAAAFANLNKKLAKKTAEPHAQFNRRGGSVTLDRFNLPHPSGNGDLLSDVSLTLSCNRRYGLIGRNGAGKTTLMNSFAKYQHSALKMLKVLLVDQHVEGDEDSAIQWCLRQDIERTMLLEDEKALSRYLQYNPETADATEKEVYDQMEVLQTATAEARVRAVLKGLGFTDGSGGTIEAPELDMMNMPTTSLSGGWVMRASLAAAIYTDPDLLLLDEPTNHLDLHALVWLENWLTTKYTGIAIIVSHDTCFLNSTATDIIELQSVLGGRAKSSLVCYTGDYRTYENTIADLTKAQLRNREAIEAKIDKLKEFIAREGKKYDGPAHQNQRRMRMKQLEGLEQEAAALNAAYGHLFEEEKSVQIRLPTPIGHFNKDTPLIMIENVSFGYPPISPLSSGSRSNINDSDDTKTSDAAPIPVLFKQVEFSIYANSRIVLLGRNGSGKTSFLNLLIDGGGSGGTTMVPLTGCVKRYPGCKITMLQQHHYKGDQLDPSLNANEHIRLLQLQQSANLQQQQLLMDPHAVSVALASPISPISELVNSMTRQEESQVRNYLANFGIVRNVSKLPVRNLSGGQKMKLALAVALFDKPDVIILDEPTNHLDAETVKSLSNAIASFEGAVIAVSHDESFVNSLLGATATAAASEDKDGINLNTAIYTLSNQRIMRFEGTFQKYKQSIMKSIR